MVDTVDTLVVHDSQSFRVVRLTNISDGTGESGVAKIDKSALTDTNGREPKALDVEWLEWSVQGFSSVRLYWDHTTDDEIAVLSGDGSMKTMKHAGALRDPLSAGGTGDIILTTNGGSAGATYNITIKVRLRPSD